MWLQAVLMVAGAAALIYQALALTACLVFLERSRIRRGKVLKSVPGVSVLKPVRGLDDALERAIRSNLAQAGCEVELLIGVASRKDNAVPLIEKMAKEDARLRLVVAKTRTENAKVGVLADLVKAARHEIVILNDADIAVPADYARRVAALLEEPRVGLVTCLYRAGASSVAGRFEAVGIACDFMPSTLVAPLAGVDEFGFGSTLCFRKADLEKAGGMAAIGDYIADDYQLAKRVTALGRGARMSEVVVETSLGAPGWGEVWRHQLRWARTIRVSRPGGYAGLPATQAGLWALLNLAVGNVGVATALWVARVAMGATAGFAVLRHWPALLVAPLLPLWDVWAFAVWAAGLMGRTVEWRGRRIRLEKDGRMTVISSRAN